MIATTLNIHVGVLAKISKAAIRFNQSRRKTIVMLLMMIMEDQRFFARCFSTVKYQPDDNEENWHCFHIRFREDENEFFVDLRKLCKFSVSYLLALAVDRYLGALLKRVKKSVDNNIRFINYVQYHEVVDGIFSWRIYWGYPIKEIKTLRL